MPATLSLSPDEWMQILINSEKVKEFTRKNYGSDNLVLVCEFNTKTQEIRIWHDPSGIYYNMGKTK